MCEGTGENLFVVRDGEIVTPPLSSSMLDGINRRSVDPDRRATSATRSSSATIARAELYLADEIYCTGTAAELTPIREVDDHAIGTGKPGEVTRAVQAAFEDALHGRSDRYAQWLDPVPAAALLQGRCFLMGAGRRIR